MSTAGNSERRSAIYVSNEGNITNANASDAKLSTISGVSTDGTLGTNSDALLPTEKAIKTYVDGHTGSAPAIVECYFSTPAATVLTLNTWTKAAGTSTEAAAHPDFTHSNNRFTYTGANNIIIHGFASFSVTAATNNKVFEFGVAKNGTIVTPSIMRRKISTGADVGTGALHFVITMATNDYFEFFIRNITDSTNATLELMNLGCMAPTPAYVGTIP